MKLLGEYQNFLLTGVESGFKSVSFFLYLNPTLLQVFEIGRHVGMKDSVWDISFKNRLYDNWENGGVRHCETLSANPYPPKVRLQKNGILVPQCPTIHLSYHPPGSYEPPTVVLIVTFIVEHYTLDERVMWTISSCVPKLSQSSARVISDASPNAKQRNIREFPTMIDDSNVLQRSRTPVDIRMPE